MGLHRSVGGFLQSCQVNVNRKSVRTLLEGVQSDSGEAFQFLVIGSSFSRMLALEFVVICKPQKRDSNSSNSN
jgi:hypothetical protein